MNRIWLGRMVGFLIVLIAAVMLFSQDWSHIGDTADLISIATIAILWAVFLIIMWRVRRGRMTLPPPGRVLLIGVGLVVASFAWLFFCLALLQPQSPDVTVAPFFVLLLAGLVFFAASAGLKIYQRVSHSRAADL